MPGKDERSDLCLLDDAITKKTALVAVSHLSNVTGLVYPVKEIAFLAYKRGARIPFPFFFVNIPQNFT